MCEPQNSRCSVAKAIMRITYMCPYLMSIARKLMHSQKVVLNITNIINLWITNYLPFRSTWWFCRVRGAEHVLCFIDHCLSFCPFSLWTLHMWYIMTMTMASLSYSLIYRSDLIQRLYNLFCHYSHKVLQSLILPSRSLCFVYRGSV